MAAPTTVDIPPMSRRDVWHTIALAVAKGEIPQPYQFTVRGDLTMVELIYTDNVGDPAPTASAARAAAHLSLPSERVREDGKGQTWYARRDGWAYHVRVFLDDRVDPTPEAPSPLAEQVIAAIENPAPASQIHWECQQPGCLVHIVGPDDAETNQTIDAHLEEHFETDALATAGGAR